MNAAGKMRIPEKKDIEEAAKTYILAANVNCTVFDANGEIVAGSRLADRSHFCQLVQEDDEGKCCRKSYVYGGQQAEKLGEPYIYFCPYGLVNWAVPVVGPQQTNLYLVGGPVLLHKTDDLLIEEITRQNPLLLTRVAEVRDRLEKLQVLDPVRVNHLAGLLMMVAKSLLVRKPLLENQGEKGRINANVARVVQDIKREIFTRENGEALGKPYPFEREKELLEKVALGDREGANEILHDILSYIFCYNSFEMVKLLSVSLMVVMGRTALEVGADLEMLFGIQFMQIKKIFNMTDLNELMVAMTKAVNWFIDCTIPVGNVKNRHVIFKAVNYIREHYNSIRLEDVAAAVGLNPTYFSRLFKEETGKSYTEYLNRIRVEVSKDLLRKGVPLAEIAQRVGFNDQSYFTTIFKKYEGVSPRKWQQGKRSPRS